MSIYIYIIILLYMYYIYMYICIIATSRWGYEHYSFMLVIYIQNLWMSQDYYIWGMNIQAPVSIPK